jgi:hypothetical protein
MPGYPLQRQAQQLANAGRYGDTMLMHVNPAEVQGLASMMPLTTNPQTGQPEAFLPFLVPLLGSILGTTALPAALTSLGAAAGTGGLGAALSGMGGFLAASPGIAGAIGSGVAEWGRTGDFKQGLVSGLTGYGAGKVLGNLGQAATKDALTQTAKEALPNVAKGSLIPERLASDVLSETGKTGATGLPWGDVTGLATNLNQVDQGALAEALRGTASTAFKAGGSNWAKEGLREAWRNPGALLSAAQKPGAMIPMVAGMGMSSAEESRRLWEQQMAQFDAENEERKRRIEAEHPEIVPISNPYSRRYASQGGIVG